MAFLRPGVLLQKFLLLHPMDFETQLEKTYVCSLSPTYKNDSGWRYVCKKKDERVDVCGRLGEGLRASLSFLNRCPYCRCFGSLAELLNQKTPNSAGCLGGDGYINSTCCASVPLLFFYIQAQSPVYQNASHCSSWL
jgi:hypothetical protein